MKNNAFEECMCPPPTPLEVAHANLLANKIGLPSWAVLKCPYCKEEMSLTSVRSISIKLNPRNVGDLCVEFLCSKCEIGNTLYFRKEIGSMEDFVKLLNGSKSPAVAPIVEEEMYKQKYHNTVEAMVHSKET